MMFFTNIFSQTPQLAGDPISYSVASSLVDLPYPKHLSCDGTNYRSSVYTMKVFAWNGGDGGWAYDYNSAGPLTMNYSLPANVIEHPEIALVYAAGNSDYIYAVAVYEDPGATPPGTYYEAYLWTGSSFSGTPTYSGIIDSVSNDSIVINVSGDNYGHIIIVYDDGTLTNTSFGQLTAYIDTSNGSLVFGTPGTITDNSLVMSQPDADVTYEYGNPSPDNGMIYLSYIYDGGTKVAVSEVDFGTMFTGGPLDLTTYKHKLAEVPVTYIADHVSIAVNDGYNAYLNTYFPHAAVAFREDDIGHTSENINLFAVKKGNYTISSMVLNVTPISYVYNRNPTVAVEPYEIEATTAWDFDDQGQSTGLLLDGLAHTATYNSGSNTYSSATDDMQVQTDQSVIPGTGSGYTTVTTVSGYTEDSLIYFYYDDATNIVEYKGRPYSNSSLRKGLNSIENNASIYPNPVKNSIHINFDGSVSEATITDVIGQVVEQFHGSITDIEQSINKKLSSFDRGLYFLKLTDKTRNTTFKFIKD